MLTEPSALYTGLEYERPFAVVEDDVVDIPENGFIGHRAQFG